MRALHAVSYAFQVLWREWRVWLVLAWLPALAVVGEQLLFAAYGPLVGPWPYEQGLLPAELAKSVALNFPKIVPAIAVLFFIPAITTWYRHLLRSDGAEADAKLRVGRSEARYLVYYLLFAALVAVLQGILFDSIMSGLTWSIGGGLFEAWRHVPSTAMHWVDYSFWTIVDSLTHIISLLLLARFFLVLPDASIGRRSGFWALWRRSRGCLTAIVVALAVMLAFAGLVGEAAVAVTQMMLNDLVLTYGLEEAQMTWRMTFWQTVQLVGEFAGDYLRAIGTAAVLAWFYRDLVLSRKEQTA